MNSTRKGVPLKNKGKKSKKKLLRNILSLQDDSFWPLYPGEKLEELNEILSRELTLLRSDRPKIPWSKLCKMSKEERKLTIKNNTDEKSLKGLELRNHVTLGVNATCRRIEQSGLAFCLLEPTEDMVSQMVVSLAYQKSVPLALLPGLKQLTKQVMGVPTIALGFKTDVLEESSPLYGCSSIKELIINNIKVPETKKISSDHKSVETLYNPVTQERLFSKEDIHLMRPKEGGRAFVLANRTPREDYISLGEIDPMVPEYKISTFKRFLDEDPGEQINNDRKERIFESPVVLSVKSNPNKMKKRKS